MWRKCPIFSGLKSILDERYYLYAGASVELRFQKHGDAYEIERMAESGPLTRTQEKIEVTEEKFTALKQFGREPLIRESYLIQTNPQITLKVYHGRFEGLTRIEVEFSSLAEAESFESPQWFGKEITDLPIARDAKLVAMTDEEYNAGHFSA